MIFLNKSVRKKARDILKNKKRCVQSTVFAFLSAATGIATVRVFLGGRVTPYTIAASVALSAVYFVIKACANHRLQVQMILLVANGGKPHIRFGEYVANVLLTLCLSVLRILELIAFEAIPVCLVAALFFSIKRSALSAVFFVIMLGTAAVTAVLGLIFYGFSVQKYAKAPFLFAAYPSLSIRECIRLSAESGEKKAADLLRFKLGFLPWLPVCAAIFPLLYVVPYYKQSLTCWFKQGF